MGAGNRTKKTTIRLTESDQKVLQRLTELTGASQAAVIRGAIRRFLARVEADYDPKGKKS